MSTRNIVVAGDVTVERMVARSAQSLAARYSAARWPPARRLAVRPPVDTCPAQAHNRGMGRRKGVTMRGWAALGNEH